MRLDTAGGNVVFALQLSHERYQRVELRFAGRLLIEVAQAEHTQIAFIVSTDVGTLPVCGTTLPDATGTIDCEVVPNVTPATIAVRPANGIKSAGDGLLLRFEEWCHAIVMHSYVPHRQHVVHARGDWIAGSPL